MPDSRKEVVVIGAGLSGLVCAYRLRQLGVEVLLLEKSAQAGGVMQSERRDGFLIERGPNSARGTAELLALVEELGLAEELLEGNPRAPAYVYFGGRLRAVPMNPSALLKTDLLSAAGKLRLAKEPFVARRSKPEEESVAAFFTRRLGGEVTARLVAPFVSGIYAGDENRLSIQAAFPQLPALESGYGSLFRGAIGKLRETRKAKAAPPQSSSSSSPSSQPKTRRSISFRAGMQALPDALAQQLGDCLWLNTGCQLQPQSGARGGFTLDIERDGSTQRLVCDHLVIATPAFAAAGLLEPRFAEFGKDLLDIEYPPLTILHLAYARAAIANSLDGFGFLAAPAAGLAILGCIFNSSQFAHRAPSGKTLLTIFIGGARNPELAHRQDAELVATAHAELQKVLGISSAPQDISVARWQRSIPQYNLGHAARVQRLVEVTRALPGLHLIGNYLHGVAVGDCLRDAEQTAQQIRGSLESGD